MAKIKNATLKQKFIESIGIFILFLPVSILFGVFMTWSGEQFDKTEKERELYWQKFASECKASGGKAVTRSYQHKRFNYRNRYETRYETNCEK